MTERREYGAVDQLTHGVQAGRPQLSAQVHPVQAAVARQERLEAGLRTDWLRQVQGVHAPLRLHAEQRAASRVGRLPFLQSSNIMMDTLTGRDDTLGGWRGTTVAEACCLVELVEIVLLVGWVVGLYNVVMDYAYCPLWRLRLPWCAGRSTV